MKKYQLERLKALTMAGVLMVTLSACKEKEETKVDLGPSISGVSSTLEEKLNLLNQFEGLKHKLEEEKRKRLEREQEIREKVEKDKVTLDEAMQKLESEDYFDEVEKEFVKAFLNDSKNKQYISSSNAINIASGDTDYLVSEITIANTSIGPFYDVCELFRPSFNKDSIRIFNNSKGSVSSLPRCYIPMIYRNTYDSFNVYEVNSTDNFGIYFETNYFVITDLNGKIIAHTYNGYNRVNGNNISGSLNYLLGKHGLSNLILDVYSEADLRNIRLELSKKISGYSASGDIRTSDMLVFDATRKENYPRLDPCQDYYFMEYICPDAFSIGTSFYGDVFSPTATAVINGDTLFYENLAQDDGLVPFYFDDCDHISKLSMAEFLKTTEVPTYMGYRELQNLYDTYNKQDRGRY